VREGGVLVSATLPAQAMRAQVASGYTAGDTILVISPVSLSSYSNFHCIAAGWVVVDKKCSHHRCETLPLLTVLPLNYFTGPLLSLTDVLTKYLLDRKNTILSTGKPGTAWCPIFKFRGFVSTR
jgi:hypothetical protein